MAPFRRVGQNILVDVMQRQGMRIVQLELELRIRQQEALREKARGTWEFQYVDMVYERMVKEQLEFGGRVTEVSVDG